jgi:hypothetical protein
MMSVAANSFLQSVVSYPNASYGHSGRNISAEQFLSACMVLTLTLSGVSGMTNILAVPLLISLLRSALIYISHSPWQFKHSAFESILTPIFSALIVVSDFLDSNISFPKSLLPLIIPSPERVPSSLISSEPPILTSAPLSMVSPPSILISDSAACCPFMSILYSVDI